MSELDSVTYQWMARGAIRTLGTGSTIMGAAMIWGGPERFSGPGFAAARLVPGGVYTWGATLSLAGAVVLLGILKHWTSSVVSAGILALSCWFMFFVISLGIVTLRSPAGSVTGPCAYGILAVIGIVFGVGGLGRKR